MNNRIEQQAHDRTTEQTGGPAEELTILDDRYALDFPLTYAASGTTWLATDTFTAGAKRVAVKFLSRLDEADADELVLLRTRFTPAQLQAARALPRIEDLGGFEAEPFIVFSRTDGQPLDEYWKRNASGAPVPVSALLQFAKAVQTMHAAGVLHLDIAPAHLTYDAAAQAVRLLDWGHALALDSHTPPIAPATELAVYAGPGLFGEVDPQPRDDVYATACVIYEALSGEHPYAGRTASAAAAMGLAPAPIAALNADQNAVLALALSTSRKQPQIDMAQLIAVFERGGIDRSASAEGSAAVGNKGSRMGSTTEGTPALPVAPAAKAPDRPAMSPRPAATTAAKAPSTAPSSKDQLAARTASIEAMLSLDQSKRGQPPSDPEPDLIEPSIAHEYISSDDTMPPRTAVAHEDESTTVPIAPASRETRAEPFISSSTLSPSSRGPSTQPPRSGGSTSQPPRSPGVMSQPPRAQAPLSHPPGAYGPASQPPRAQRPLSQPPLSQPPLSQPPRAQRPLSQPPLSQPPLSQPPISDRPALPMAGQRPGSSAADFDQLFRGTEFERTHPNLSRPREWAVTLPLGLTITIASCVIGVVAGVWLASSGSGKRPAVPSASPAMNAPASVDAQPATPTPPAAAQIKPPATGTADAVVAKPEPSVPPVTTDAAKAEPKAAPGGMASAPAMKAPTPEASATPATAVKPAAPPAPARQPVAPAAIAPAPQPAPPVAAAPPRPAIVAPKPAAPVANAPAAPPAGVDLLDATMATRALTERVARETEEELARIRAASKQPQ